LFFTTYVQQDSFQNPLTDSWQLNYLTKYLELIDTCFLFLKKKPLSERATF
jgi:fatty acid elongase 3